MSNPEGSSFEDSNATVPFHASTADQARAIQLYSIRLIRAGLLSNREARRFIIISKYWNLKKLGLESSTANLAVEQVKAPESSDED